MSILSSCKLFSLILLALLLVSVSFKFCAVAEDMPNDSLFNFVWDDSLRGYYIESNRTFPLMVYVLSLSDVGNYRVSNHSAVVEGVKQAVKIHPGDSQVKELFIPLWGTDLVMKLNVNISYTMIEDWNTYKALVESGNDTIIVNTHDEYLPIPEGYRKEEWVDRVADFMLNRWGTWVHAGGYPLYRVWYQNGTKEEWGEIGFKHLMSHIGKGNVTCYPPPSWNPEEPATFSGWASQGMGLNWFLYGDPIASFHYVSLGFPINWYDFEAEGLYVGNIYSYAQYKPGAIIRFSQNQSTFNFGMYIHMGALELDDIDGGKLLHDLGIGFISTAAAIYEEFYYAAKELYSIFGEGAAETIQLAEKEGRVIGLTEAKNLFLDALDAFASGNYKLSATLAMQAEQTAKNATTLNTVPQTIAIIGILVVSIGIGSYYKFNGHNKSKRGNTSECAKPRQCL